MIKQRNRPLICCTLEISYLEVAFFSPLFIQLVKLAFVVKNLGLHHWPFTYNLVEGRVLGSTI